MARERWASRSSFVMAAIGSAIGLGNVWRFPYIAYENGGGAFFIPYFVALLTAGIPLLVLEFGLGQRYQAASVGAMRAVGKKWEWVGWYGAFNSLGVVMYYSVIMAWAVCYIVFSFDLAWGDDPGTHFSTFLGRTADPGTVGGISWPIVGALAICWIAVYFILAKGVMRVGKVVWVTVPLPLLCLVILAIRGLTLDGAADGIAYYLTPDFGVLADPEVWLKAYGQIFFSIGLGWGIMITYASYRPKDTSVVNNAFITSLANCGTSFFAGFAVFSTLGFLAMQKGVPVEGVAKSGIGLAFEVYPAAISQLPFAAGLFGVIFFLMLLTLGIDSAFSMVEAVVGGFADRWKVSKVTLTRLICVLGFALGIPFCAGAGFHWLDIVDAWFSMFGLAVVGFLECVIIGWFFDHRSFRTYINSVSEIRAGAWWSICIRFITPIVLGVSIVLSVVKMLTEGYGGFPTWSLIVFGWLVITIVIVVSFILARNPEETTGEEA
jgi:NSS family neurotransmitter:Na+ symporter